MKVVAYYPDTVLAAVDWINVMAYDGGDGVLHSGYEFAIPGWFLYKDIAAEIPEAWKKDHCTYHGTEVWYNGSNTIKAKAEYAKKELGGIMMWELTQDALGEKSLFGIIGATMK